MTAQAQPPASAPSAASQAEAARYALLRRLAPSMRHHLVVNLQPIGMIYEVMDRRLRAPQPDLATVHDSAHKINGFARAALDSCLNVVTWLAPEEGAAIPVQDGVREVAGLLATSLGFRGYALRNEVGALPDQVRRSALRSVLTASMVCLTDELPAPGELVLTARAGPAGAVVVLEFHATKGEGGYAAEAGYRSVGWADVQALAAAEQAGLVREDASRIAITLPWASPAAQ